MAAYDADPANYTQSLGCWHGFIGQQKMISIKKHFGTTKRRYLYLSGWMVAALRSEFGPLPDQSMHEKTSVPALIEELYTFLRQADARELGMLFRELDAAREAGDDEVDEQQLPDAIDNYETHVVPIIADIDAGFGNAEATYLLAKKMIEAGACAIQIENQVSDEKQCGHQDGKVTVPHEDFLAKVRAVPLRLPRAGRRRRRHRRPHRLARRGPHQADRRHATTPGDLGDQYNASSTARRSTPADMQQRRRASSTATASCCGRSACRRNLFQFRAGTGEDRCVLDCITSLQNGADLLWIETEKPHIEQIAGMVDRIREVIPNAKLVYNNRPSFNWTLNFRQQVYDAWAEGRQGRLGLRPREADERGLRRHRAGRRGRRDASAPSRRDAAEARRDLPPPDHAADLSHGGAVDRQPGQGVLRRARACSATCKSVQREEIRQGIACVKHQNMAGSDIGDDHKEYFAGEAALKAGGAHNTMNQFG